MKAIVLEVKDGMAAALCDDGTVKKFRGAYAVGDTFEIADLHPVPAWRKGLRAAVAAVALVGILSTGGYSYQNVLAYSYVSLDVGSTSLEYTLNRRNQVINVTGLNDASGTVADSLHDELRKQELSNAILRTMEYLDESGNGDDSHALVSVTSGSDDRASQLADTVDHMAQTSGDSMEFLTETASREDRRAEIMGLSTGRYQLRRKVGEDGNMDFRNGDIDDLMGKRPENGKDDNKDPTKTSGAESGGSSGQQAPKSEDPGTPKQPDGQDIPSRKDTPDTKNDPKEQTRPAQEQPGNGSGQNNAPPTDSGNMPQEPDQNGNPGASDGPVDPELPVTRGDPPEEGDVSPQEPG